jgi:hypothetical protein
MTDASLLARRAVPAAALLLMVGCAAQKPRIETPPPAPPPLDASYDWHVLLTAPFGSVLKDIPLALHEVLVFRDTETAASSADDAECYAANGLGPRFIARTPSEYLLCFKHERLSRVEATVRLPNDEADRILADACGLWTKSTLAAGAEGCEGADGGVIFSAHLEKVPGEADSPLTVQLDAADLAADAAAGRAPDRQ